MVSLSLGKEMDQKTLKENALEKNFNIGLDHAMNLLGELLENECDSFP